MSFQINAAWVRSPGQRPDTGAERSEDEASLARLSMSVGSVDLVRVEDREAQTVRAYSVLPGYALAEWLAWHWWRLCWEPQRPSDTARRLRDWDRAHRMQTIGGGWLWPPVTLISDGERMRVSVAPSGERNGQPVSYLAGAVCVIPLRSFEAATDEFVDRVLCQLDAHGLRGSELETIWQEVNAERADAELARYRRTEALLGCDPDEATPDVIEAVLRDAETLGQGAMAEVAGMASDGVMTATSLNDWAHRHGFGGRIGDRVELNLVDQSRGVTPAWRLGASAAQALREQERLGDGPLSNTRLAALCGVDKRAVDPPDLPVGQRVPLAFDLAHDKRDSQVVLRSRWETGRRFELARLLGDHLTDTEAERLHPATNTYTYRQKVQRAFAAELLAPTDSLATYLDGAASAEEAIEDAAGDFNVSPWVVTRLLVNDGHLGADFLNDAEPESSGV